jgi:disease resistance protein RPM1
MYFIVIDDVWEAPSWKKIRIALEENNLGSKIMITTHSCDVAELVHCTYKMQPRCPDSCKILFHERIFGSPDRCPERFSELSDKILKKCGGVCH